MLQSHATNEGTDHRSTVGEIVPATYVTPDLKYVRGREGSRAETIDGMRQPKTKAKVPDGVVCLTLASLLLRCNFCSPRACLRPSAMEATPSSPIALFPRYKATTTHVFNAGACGKGGRVRRVQARGRGVVKRMQWGGGGYS